MTKKKFAWGFDVRELDATIRPQDDFYRYVNAQWMRANPIPPAESRWGSFVILRYETDKQLKCIMDELLRMKRVVQGSPEQLIRDLYRSGMDMERRNKLGIQPIAAWRNKIAGAHTKQQLLDVIAELHVLGIGVLWGAGIDQDAKNSERYALHFGQDGLGMPEREYYLKNDAESLRVRRAYLKHVERLYRLMGEGPSSAKVLTQKLLAIETALANASMKKEDRRDPDKTYHKMTHAQLAKTAPGIDWHRYLRLTQTPDVPYVIVLQPDFFKAVSRLLDTVSLADWRTYLEWHLVNDFSSALSAPFVREAFSFYGTALSGTKRMKPLWRCILGSVNGSLGEPLGQIYVQKHFSPAAKKRMQILVADLFTAYEARLKSLTWMTPATKKKALMKLHSLTRKIGYPDKWKKYTGLVLSPTDYAGNLIRSSLFEHKRQMKKLRGPIDRSEWFMYPQTVNAYFAPNLNDIVFPAAILQPPFFGLDADDSVNYGAIGAVIGHEITHGFDDEGSKFDAKGNLKSWWTQEDRKRFEAKAKKVEKQFDRYTVADGLKVNGKLTLGENIADLGGLSIAYDAYQLSLARTGRKDIDELTPEQRFFIAFAIFERENARPEFEKMQVLTDPHSPGKFRINGPTSNFDEFYKAFGVKKGDKMFRPAPDREMVW